MNVIHYKSPSFWQAELCHQFEIQVDRSTFPVLKVVLSVYKLDSDRIYLFIHTCINYQTKQIAIIRKDEWTVHPTSFQLYD